MWKEKIEAAHHRIKDEVRKTPLEYSPVLSKLSGQNVFLKLENYQITGSFKIRGVMNKLLTLSPQQMNEGLVACSTGNHGAAFAYAVDKFGSEGLLFLPKNVARAKLEALKHYQLTLEFFGDDCVDTEVHARKVAEQENKTLIHPYNDPDIVCGQGTIGVELMEQLPQSPDEIIVPVGGGGLISGISAYVKSVSPGTVITGCQPENSAVMKHSLEAGHLLVEESLPTLSDATAGGIEQNAITFKMCQEFVDQVKLVSEDEIRKALRLMIEHHHMIIEGAAAMSVATLLQKREGQPPGKNIVLILCGKKIGFEELRECIL